MTLIERIAEAAEAEPARVRPVLQLLVGDRLELPDELRTVGSALNEARRSHALEEFLAGAVATDEVIELLPSIGTRQGVHRLRKAGRLWGRTVGNATWFPAWQFSSDGLRDDLAAVLERIARFTVDVVAADRIMRLPREELGGRTIAEALDSRRWRSAAWRLLDALGTG